ncbi:hypothetical protein A7E75_04880 [Syntrophotalea acetylenica]|uniref:Uncharacterized protein n=1 Tax=Syntrophotalea acetylenica TaxID=29542 RepID=A0A1L3GER4_SYNAC|nr:hypothetical protein A7E75_04880 [Syntrophotalea acetylenica]APG45026.1 hypothetical protein A6070_13525 [Syntrophotalea acetylenica]
MGKELFPGETQLKSVDPDPGNIACCVPLRPDMALACFFSRGVGWCGCTGVMDKKKRVVLEVEATRKRWRF